MTVTTVEPTCVVDACTQTRHGKGVCRAHYMKAWRGQIAWPTFTDHRPSRAQRFWAKVERGDNDECWRWQASYFPNGYGQFDHEGAHRVAYELSVGPIPDGLVIDHLCGQQYCVNPNHLEPVTPQQNTLRGYGPNVSIRLRRDLMAQRTHCKSGHRLTPENTYVWPKTGWRQCRTCKSAADRRRRLRRREAA